MNTNLLELEQTYLEQLSTLNSLLYELTENKQIPVFRELLSNTQELNIFHKDFYKEIKSKDANKLALYWTTERTKNLYYDYFNNLNQCQATVCTPSTQKVLEEMKLDEKIFQSPLRQLASYKTHFNNIPNLVNSPLLLQANQLFDTLMNPILHLDTLHVIDIITEEPVTHYHLQPMKTPLIEHSFHSLDLQKDLQLALTEDYLLFIADNQLIFPSLSLDMVSVRPFEEHGLRLLVDQKRTFTLETGSRKERDLWLGSDLSDRWSSLEKTSLHLSKKAVKTNDLFCYFQDPSGEVSPIESSDDENWKTNNEGINSVSTMENIKAPESRPVASLKQPEIVTQRKSFIKSVFSAVSSPQLKAKDNTHLAASPESPQGPSLHHQSSHSSLSSTHSNLATPPLSRSGSPGNSTPVSQLRNSTCSDEDSGEKQQTPLKSAETIKQVIHRDEQCQVFHWKDETWHAAEESSILEIRQTYSLRPCVTVHMKKTGQMYLNAWISKEMAIQRISDTDINLTVQCDVEEHYLVHCTTQRDADRLDSVLKQMLEPPVELLAQEDLAKSLEPAIECKCKLYLQSSSSKWRSFGSIHLKISQHKMTKKMHLAAESHKGGKTTQLVSAMVVSRNVERLGSKQISLLFNNEKTSMVYMIKLRDESTADKVVEYLKDKNAANGW